MAVPPIQDMSVSDLMPHRRHFYVGSIGLFAGSEEYKADIVVSIVLKIGTLTLLFTKKMILLCNNFTFKGVHGLLHTYFSMIVVLVLSMWVVIRFFYVHFRCMTGANLGETQMNLLAS